MTEGEVRALEDVLLEVDGLSIRYQTRMGPLTSVDDVSFSLRRAETLVILGETGSGKSSLLRTIMGLQPKSATVEGAVRIGDRELLSATDSERRAMRGSLVSMVFQDPMTALDPVYTVGAQLIETIRCHSKLGRKSARQRAIDLLTTVNLAAPESRLGSYPHELSGGMRQRVMIAIAIAAEPVLLLADEPTTALDVTVRTQVLRTLKQLRAEMSMSIIFVTHDLSVAVQFGDRVAVMYAGKIVEQGTVDEVVGSPQHPYTEALVRADLRPGQTEPPQAIRGSPPDLRRLPSGCAFAPRCDVVETRCALGPIAMLPVTATRSVRCVRALPDGRGPR